jgi:phage terminase small subunit
MDMLTMLQRVALGQVEATPLQVRAAIAAIQYTHTKKGDGGKKDAAKDAARQAGSGRFKASEPPFKVVQ